MMDKESIWIRNNMKSFGKYELLVRQWCNKFDIAWIMTDFKVLFDMISLQAKKEVFDDIEEVWKKCPNEDIKEMILKDLEEIKKRHLSTSQSEGTELSSSGSPDGSPKDCSHPRDKIYTDLKTGRIVCKCGKVIVCDKYVRNPSDD